MLLDNNKAATAESLRLGDTVQLGSDETKMVVTALTNNFNTVTCTWFDGETIVYSNFNVSDLVKISPTGLV